MTWPFWYNLVIKCVITSLAFFVREYVYKVVLIEKQMIMTILFFFNFE